MANLYMAPYAKKVKRLMPESEIQRLMAKAKAYFERRGVVT